MNKTKQLLQGNSSINAAISFGGGGNSSSGQNCTNEVVEQAGIGAMGGALGGGIFAVGGAMLGALNALASSPECSGFRGNGGNQRGNGGSQRGNRGGGSWACFDSLDSK